MTVGKLKSIIKDLPDDFDIEMRVRERIPDEQLLNSTYPYPFKTIYTELEYDDVGWSDKELCLGCEINKKEK